MPHKTIKTIITEATAEKNTIAKARQENERRAEILRREWPGFMASLHSEINERGIEFISECGITGHKPPITARGFEAPDSKPFETHGWLCLDGKCDSLTIEDDRRTHTITVRQTHRNSDTTPPPLISAFSVSVADADKLEIEELSTSCRVSRDCFVLQILEPFLRAVIISS